MTSTTAAQRGQLMAVRQPEASPGASRRTSAMVADNPWCSTRTVRNDFHTRGVN